MKHGIIFFLAACLAGKAQVPASLILQNLGRLNTAGSVLYVAAHPDDENTRLLSYLASEKKLRTAYLSLTRGDGGQNLIGKEQGEALGLIRTQELLAARRTDGAEQYFTRAYDFGYSKTPEETLQIWDRDSVLSDMVWVIRQFRPDVIICRFPTTGEGGHGHHTASAILALEAFKAAADPGRFSWQLRHFPAWQARRVLWNTFNFGGNNTTAPNQMKLDVGGYNPLLGKSYGEIAAESRTMHKSQGFGSARNRGTTPEYFKLLAGDSAAEVFAGCDFTWGRLKGGKKIAALIERCLRSFNASEPQRSIARLEEIYTAISKMNDSDPETAYWKKQKLEETKLLLLQCAGIWLEAAATEPYGVNGRSTTFQVQIICRNPTPARLESIRFPYSDSVTALSLRHNEMFTFRRAETVHEDTSDPYWLKAARSQGLFRVDSIHDIGRPERGSALKCAARIRFNRLLLDVDAPVIFKSTDPVKGEQYRPFEILPLLAVGLSENVLLFTDKKPKTIYVTLKAHAANLSGVLKILSNGWTVKADSVRFVLKEKGEEQRIRLTVWPPEKQGAAQLSIIAECDGGNYSQGLQRIAHDHIPPQFILRPSQCQLKTISLKRSADLVGYIPGAGDEVAHYLAQLGYRVKEVTEAELSSGDLAEYPAIVTGVRAYNTNERLQLHYPRLMEYVKNGGNLVVQYNTNNRFGPVPPRIGPYPLTISRERVTDEQASVKFLLPEHPALNFPNKIDPSDFESWVQERGIYFAGERDDRYQALLEMSDPGEKSQNGSLIVCAYGRGNFAYSGLAFFRQLPAGVPGACRLLANLISLPQNK